jgi:hypothetical protein
MPVPAVSCVNCDASLPIDHETHTICLHHRKECPKYENSCYLRLETLERTERCDGCGIDIPYHDLVRHIVENHIFN